MIGVLPDSDCTRVPEKIRRHQALEAGQVIVCVRRDDFRAKRLRQHPRQIPFSDQPQGNQKPRQALVGLGLQLHGAIELRVC